MRAEPYLFFGGRCAEALDFYRGTLGAEITALVRFGDMPGAPPGAEDRVMHAALRIGPTTVLASDGAGQGAPPPGGFAISLQVASAAEAERLFGALAEGGRIEVPLMATPFAARFGKLADRFGTPWMIVTGPAGA